MVQEGSATFLYGGTVDGGRDTDPGDGGTRQVLVPGDVVIVPAGTPHQVLMPAGDSVRYLVTKVRRGTATPPE